MLKELKIMKNEGTIFCLENTINNINEGYLDYIVYDNNDSFIEKHFDTALSFFEEIRNNRFYDVNDLYAYIKNDGSLIGIKDDKEREKYYLENWDRIEKALKDVFEDGEGYKLSSYFEEDVVNLFPEPFRTSIQVVGKKPNELTEEQLETLGLEYGANGNFEPNAFIVPCRNDVTYGVLDVNPLISIATECKNDGELVYSDGATFYIPNLI